VKVMSIHGCQLAPSPLRSHPAVMPLRSALTVSVDRPAPPASAASGLATGATSPLPVNRHTPCSSTLARIIVTLPRLS
jgi:hypothetical protein